MMFDCTDIDLRMHFAIHGGLTDHEQGAFFGHLSACTSCRTVYIAMSLIDEVPTTLDTNELSGSEPVELPRAHNAHPVEVEPLGAWPASARSTRRHSLGMLVSVAALALLIGGIGGSMLTTYYASPPQTNTNAVQQQEELQSAYERLGELQTRLDEAEKKLARSNSAAARAAGGLDLKWAMNRAKLTITSMPAGADVRLSGSREVLGQTPYTHYADKCKDERLTFTLSLAGHETRRVSFPTDEHSSKHVAMKKHAATNMPDETPHISEPRMKAKKNSGAPRSIEDTKDPFTVPSSEEPKDFEEPKDTKDPFTAP